MAIGRITYPDKVDYRQEGQDDRYKITAENMNEIKRTFNDSAEAIEKNVEDTEKLQVKLDDAINRTGHYKIEDGKIYFEQIDGSFGEGIELPAQTSAFVDGVVQGTLHLNTTRDSSANKVAVQLLDASGNALMTETLASQVYTKDGLTMETILNDSLFILEENGGETVCGDYEAYVAYLAEQQSTNEESEDETL
ncbi:hypothetical protein [Faecalibacillus faecis]|uniref:hypothetical protein n=1 Tax=Faecalibacillus faecis TaxID=1982628 RepID=UPI0022E22175|nr:hypothetical protein [Faecalibacillus faecis]